MKFLKTIPFIALLSIFLISGCKKDDDNDTVNDDTVPTVNSTNPEHNSSGVARNKVITVNFSEAMDPSTITSSTFTLNQGIISISGTVAASGSTATFTPSNILDANLVYTATVTTGIKDVAGNALGSNSNIVFTTGGTTSTLAVVNLGSSENYVILAKTAISNSPTSSVTGDMGLSPYATTYITEFSLIDATGFATSSQVVGKVYAADMADPTPITLTTAVNDMLTAYVDGANRPSPDFFELHTGNIGGKTLTPGLYKWTNTVSAATDITISGGADDVWIFQIAENLSIGSAVNVNLIGGAQAKNVFWVVAGQATIGTTSHFEGVILSMTAITLQTDASIKGRLLAQSAVTLDKNIVVQP